jgi:hypothetical protein
MVVSWLIYLKNKVLFDQLLGTCVPAFEFQNTVKPAVVVTYTKQ